MRIFGACLLTLWLACCGWQSQAWACLWDYDTLKMERQQFPKALELITGKFLRHSKAFYEWRIKDRLKRLKATPNKLALIDDLAVAYDKIGEHAKAIAWMKKKAALKPGLYTTAANLGTFYIHSGQLQKGLEFIEKAIKINPKAHFGREIYQAHIVSYILYLRAGNKKKLRNFKSYLFMQSKLKNMHGAAWEKLHKAAVKGILGMMRFGNYRSPVLLDALGGLLSGYAKNNPKRIATRAYLQASYQSKSDKDKKRFRELAKQALTMQTVAPGTEEQLSLSQLEANFRKELAEAEKWWKENILADETKWIKAGKNPEKEFEAKYYKASKPPSITTKAPAPMVMWPWLVGLFALLVLGIVIRKMTSQSK